MKGSRLFVWVKGEATGSETWGQRTHEPGNLYLFNSRQCLNRPFWLLWIQLMTIKKKANELQGHKWPLTADTIKLLVGNLRQDLYSNVACGVLKQHWGTIPRKAATWGQQEISAVAPSKYIFWNITSACKSLLGHIVVALLKARVDMNRRHKIEIYMVGCEREFSWSVCKTDFFVLESLHPFKFSDLVDTPSQGIFISFPFQTEHPWQHFCMVWQILRSSIPKQITDMFTIIYGGLFTSILHCMTFNSKKGKY